MAVLVLVRGSGIVTVGVIYLAVQAGLAVLLLPALVRQLRHGDIELPEFAVVTAPGAQPLPDPPAGAAADPAASFGREERR